METFRKELEAAFGRTPVFGEGAQNAKVMLIGEAPGEQEEKLGRPFVGKAGKNLDEFLALAGIDRDALYVTNAVKFRPTRISKAGRTVNRPPTKQEIAAFRPWLLREVALVCPEVIVTLGNVPLFALTNSAETVGTLHGKLLEANGFRLFPMYHPASMIYNPALREVWRADIMTLAEIFIKH